MSHHGFSCIYKEAGIANCVHVRERQCMPNSIVSFYTIFLHGLPCRLSHEKIKPCQHGHIVGMDTLDEMFQSYCNHVGHQSGALHLPAQPSSSGSFYTMPSWGADLWFLTGMTF